MKVGLFTDPHASDMELTCQNRRPALSFGKIRTAMEYFSANGIELVICLGDLLNRCVDHADDKKEYLRLTEMIRSFELPFYCVRGNHDCQIFSEDDFYQIGGLEKIPFVKIFDDRALIFLDACFHEDGERYSLERADWTDSMLPREQVERLRTILSDPRIRNATVFLHQLLNPDADARYLVKNADQIREILEGSGKVHQVYSGHFHRGQQSLCNGIVYTALPAMCVGEENRYFIVDI